MGRVRRGEVRRGGTNPRRVVLPLCGVFFNSFSVKRLSTRLGKGRGV